MNKDRAKLDKVYDECIKQIGDGDEVDTATAIDCLCEIWNAWNEYTKQDEWVDVNDRLPSEDETHKHNKYFYVTVKNDYVLSGISVSIYSYDIETENWYNWQNYNCTEDVIAWKPLPKPYERKE